MVLYDSPSYNLATWPVKMIHGARKYSQGHSPVSSIHNSLPGKKIYRVFYFLCDIKPMLLWYKLWRQCFFFFIFETEINHIVFYPLKNSKALLLFSFILSSNKYLLSDYYLPSILQSTGDGPVSKVYGDKYYERQWSRKWVGEREVIWHRSLTVKEYLYRDLKEGRESAT